MRKAIRRPVLAVVMLCLLGSVAMTGCDVDWDAAFTEFRSTAVPDMATALGDLIQSFLDGLSAVLTPDSGSSGSS